MGAEEFGPWEPLTVAASLDVFRLANFRWWLAGGYALEAHLNRSWRRHEDTDVGIIRSDAPHLRDVLDGWDIVLAAGGELTHWETPDAS